MNETRIITLLTIIFMISKQITIQQIQ